MKEKILELLKTKFIGVSDQTLSRMADKAAKTVLDDEAAQSYVTGLNFQTVIDSEADYRATKATQTSIENYEKKYGVKEGKPIQKADEPEKKQDVKTDEIPDWGKSVLTFINAMAEKEKKAQLNDKKSQVVAKLITSGADEKDKATIQSLVDMAAINDDSDVDEKATAILGIYNSLKKAPPTKTPDKTDDDGDLDAFAKMLDSAAE